MIKLVENLQNESLQVYFSSMYIDEMNTNIEKMKKKKTEKRKRRLKIRRN